MAVTSSSPSLSVARHRATPNELYVDRREIPLNLRPTADNAGVEGGAVFTVPAADTPTIVSVRSSASAASLQQMRSAAAVALQRRRAIAQIAKAVRALPQVAGQEDFHAHVFPVFDHVRKLHDELLPFDRLEGNTCMILRYVRNTLMDGGWSRYKDVAVAAAVAGLLEELSRLEVVGRHLAKKAFRLFFDLGLRASLPVALEAGTNEADEG